MGDGWGVVSGADLSGRVLSMMYLDFVVKMGGRALLSNTCFPWSR